MFLGRNPFELKEPPEREPLGRRLPEERRPPIEERPPVEPEEREIPDIPYTAKDPYTGKDIDLIIKQGMFVWEGDELIGFFDKGGDFITTKPEKASFWEKTEGFFSNVWRGLPVNPYYWKSPQEKWEADRKDALIAWAKEANIENPEEYVKDLLSKESGELAWQAYEPEEGALRVPKLPTRPVGEKITVGERFLGEWVIPVTILSGLGLSAIKGRAALAPVAAKPGVVGVTAQVGRVALAPPAAYEWLVGKTLQAVFGTAPRWVVGKITDAGLKRAWHKTPGYTQYIKPNFKGTKMDEGFFKLYKVWRKDPATANTMWAEMQRMASEKGAGAFHDMIIAGTPKVPPTAVVPKVPVVPPVKPPAVEVAKVTSGMKDRLAKILAAKPSDPESVATYRKIIDKWSPRHIIKAYNDYFPTPEVVKPPVEPPVEVKPEVAPPIVHPTGIKYVFNLKQFRFEPQAVEIKPGISPEADKLTTLVKSAKPARELTEALKHEELSKRVGAAAARARATGAQKAAFAAMAKLKGELPTATFTPPEAGLTEGEITALYNQVKGKLLIEDQKFFKWLNTDAALRKLLSGNIPTRSEIVLLEEMFGPELAKAILAKRPLNEKIWEATVDILNIPRAILASFDFSAWLRQGAFIVTAHPDIGARALAVDLRTFFSGKYTAEIDTAIRTSQFARLREDAGLFIAPVEEGVAIKLAAREEAYMTRLVKKIPLIGHEVRWSERAYLSTLNYLRASTFDYYAAKWKPMDYPMSTYKELATLVDWATGRGPMGKLGGMVPVINTVFFAARLQTSRVGMLFAGPAKFTSPPVRKAYIRMMLGFFGGMSAITALLALAPGIDVETDPRSTDFGKVRVGDTRLDPWAGFRPIITLLAQVIAGQRKAATGRIQDISRQETFARFMRSKYAPSMGLATDIVKGETYLGEEMTLESESLWEQFYQRLTPLFIQDMIDAVIEDGWIGGLTASPGVLGIGVVTYPGSIDAYERHVRDIPEDILMDWQRGIILSGEPLTYQNLNVVQKSWLIRHCEEIGDIPERREPGQYNFYEAERDTRDELETKLNEEMRPNVSNLLQGTITLPDYITQADYLRNKYFGPAAYMWRDSMREKLDPLLHKNLKRWHEEEIKPADKAYEEYMDIRVNPPQKEGMPDWDTWSDNLKGFLSTQPPEIRDYIENRRQSWIDNLPPERQAIEQLILDCEAILDEYYAIPEGKARLRYRDTHPEVDARLIILRGLKARNYNSANVAFTLLDRYGVSRSVLKEEQLRIRATVPRMPTREEPTPPEGWEVNPFK